MEAKVVAPPPLPPLDVSRNWNSNSNGDSNCSTPYISAPSSPQRPINLFFCSAPTSPRSSASFFSSGDLDHVSLLSHEGPPSASSIVPFDWEFKSGLPKPNPHNHKDDDDDFEFDFSGQLDMMVPPSLSSADELFERGKIRPLKPPPAMVAGDSPKSPKSPMSKFREALSPKHRKKNLQTKDPFETALDATRKSEPESPLVPRPRFDDRSRGRSKNPTNPRSNSRKGMSRSLSPLRVSEFALLQQESSQSSPQNPNLSGSSSKSGKRWKLKDFLLFRSASDGRAAIAGSGKDPLKKYFSMGNKKSDEGSFRSTTSSSGEGSVSRRRGRLSAHELHYAANRAVAEEMKKKTPLPYKHGSFLGCLGFNPALQKAFGAFAPPS